MYHKTIFHKLPQGFEVKFTIRERIIGNEHFFYTNMINIELDLYKQLSEIEKGTYYGMEITDIKGQSINYKDVDKLINYIKTKYGQEQLITGK